ncbi:MAG: potassium-transporting ATPase subunit KdpA [Bdellovibrionia bacterium]
MTGTDFVQILIYVAALVVLTPILGSFMAKVFEGQKTFLSPVLGWLESLTYRVSGVDENEEMHWWDYTKALLIFNFWGFLVVFLLQMFQSSLPLNPAALPDVTWHSAFNTAVSFMTNTNWQGYAGEVTLSYLTQMLGLTVQNFVSVATGIAVFLALTRGISRKTSKTVGNLWADLTRSTIYVLLPIAGVIALVLVSQGVVQTLWAYVDATTLEGIKQTLPLGPAASQIAIKQIGTNGGGFFNVNSAHPFENATPLSNFIEMLSLLMLPAALTYTYGKMVKSTRQGWTIFGVMLFVWLVTLAGSIASEYMHNPIFNQAGIMEGKEVRLGVTNSLIWSTATTVASNGSVNSMHSSLSPLAGGIAMFNIMLGEVIFGGVGAGMYGMLLFVLLTVFLAGLMVGRSPEYLGKRIEAKEMQMVILAILLPCASILFGAGISAVLPVGLSSLTNKGPHGLSEILYAFTSAAGNNGSAFAGLNANTVYYNVMLGITMLIGRFGVIIPAMVIAGSLAPKKVAPPSAGTFATDTPIFAILLIGVIIIVGALTFLPALSLGPIVEHFLMLRGQTF